MPDTVFITITISIVALIVSAINVFTNMRRANRKEDKDASTQMTTVIVKLENIGDDIKDVKTDVRELRGDMLNHTERLAAIEQKVRALDKAVFGSGEHKKS